MATPSWDPFHQTDRSASLPSQGHTSDDDDDFGIVYGLTSKLAEAEDALEAKTDEAEDLERLYKETNEAKKALTTRVKELERQGVLIAKSHSRNLESSAKLSVEYSKACSEREEWKKRHAGVESEVAALRLALDARPVALPLSGGTLDRVGNPAFSSVPPSSGSTWKKDARWYDDEPFYIKVSSDALQPHPSIHGTKKRLSS